MSPSLCFTQGEKSTAPQLFCARSTLLRHALVGVVLNAEEYSEEGDVVTHGSLHVFFHPPTGLFFFESSLCLLQAWHAARPSHLPGHKVRSSTNPPPRLYQDRRSSRPGAVSAAVG